MTLAIKTLSQIYPEHQLIDLASCKQMQAQLSSEDRKRRDFSLSQIALNRLCIEAIKDWIDRSLDLKITDSFPCWFGGADRLEFISKLVNGFALQIGTAKIVFIPHDTLDLSEFEIPQEWVDLSNWSADYYVPIRVDLEHNYLHLWGFISHANLKNRGEFDRIFRNYYIAQEQTISRLDLLWIDCESNTRSKIISSFLEVSQSEIQIDLDRLQFHQSVYSPRLNIPFDRWGTILNNHHYLSDYSQQSPRNLISLTTLFSNLVTDSYRGWERIEKNQPASIGFRNHPHQEIDRQIHQRILHETLEEIDSEMQQLDRSDRIDRLVTSIQNPTDETIRWQAIEYLSIIDPHHPQLPARYIRDLGIKFATDALTLMISKLFTTESRHAILLRVYPVNRSGYLPAGVKLSILDRSGNPIEALEAISRINPQDSYIQTYFVADDNDIFGIQVSLDRQEYTERLIV